MLPERTIAGEYTFAHKGFELIVATFAKLEVLELGREDGLNVGWLDCFDDLSALETVEINGGSALSIRYNDVV